MKIGVTIPSYSSPDFRLDGSALREYVSRAESEGFAGLWASDHLLTPESYQTSWQDPITALSAVAAETDTIPLGTSILICPLRNPVTLAKSVATLHYIADGRFTLGLGLGYDRREFEAVGVPFAERSARFTEGLELLRILLASRNVSFEGDFFQVDEVTIEPNPESRPRILVAGGGRSVEGTWKVPEPILERIRTADGWIGPPTNTVAADREAIHRSLSDTTFHGTDTLATNQVHLVPEETRSQVIADQRDVFGRLLSAERGLDHAEQHYLMGTINEIQEQVDDYEDAGFDQLILTVVAQSADGYLQQLRLIREQFSNDYFL